MTSAWSEKVIPVLARRQYCIVVPLMSVKMTPGSAVGVGRMSTTSEHTMLGYSFRTEKRRVAEFRAYQKVRMGLVSREPPVQPVKQRSARPSPSKSATARPRVYVVYTAPWTPCQSARAIGSMVLVVRQKWRNRPPNCNVGSAR